MNPDGFMSILMKFKRKSSSIKSGSDDFCQASRRRFESSTANHNYRQCTKQKHQYVSVCDFLFVYNYA